MHNVNPLLPPPARDVYANLHELTTLRLRRAGFIPGVGNGCFVELFPLLPPPTTHLSFSFLPPPLPVTIPLFPPPPSFLHEAKRDRVTDGGAFLMVITEQCKFREELISHA